MKTSRQLVIRLISLADQLFFSAANLLLTIMLARHYSETEFAAYGIGLSVALTLLGIQRHCYIAQNFILLPGIMKNRTAKVLGQQAIVWLTLLVIEFGVLTALLLFSDNSFHLAIAASTIVCSLIYAQLDFDRMILIKHEKYWHPLIASIAFLILNAFIFFAIAQFDLPYDLILIILGGYACVKFIFLLSALGRPDFFWGWRLVKRDFKKYFAGALSGVIGFSGHNHVPLFILGFLAAPVQAAAFVAMRGLMQPMQIVVRSMDVIDKNFFQIKSAGTAHGMKGLFIRQVSIYGLIAFIVVLLMAFFGETISRLAYGEKYAVYSPILTGWAFIFSMLVISLPMETLIVKMDKLNTYNFYRIPAGIVGSIFAFFLSGPYGAMGAVIACFSGWLISVMCALWIIREVIFPKEEKPILISVNR